HSRKGHTRHFNHATIMPCFKINNFIGNVLANFGGNSRLGWQLFENFAEKISDIHWVVSRI
ncbi:hypothetical protein, partial [Kingella kingae]|uniref:hypothetical protein n=1 Tax=Kingella kingae TaxID=504 RepID=UPI001E3397B6